MLIDDYPDFPLPENDARTLAVNLSYRKSQLLDLKDYSAEESESLVTDENSDFPDNEE